MCRSQVSYDHSISRKSLNLRTAKPRSELSVNICQSTAKKDYSSAYTGYVALGNESKKEANIMGFLEKMGVH